ncbi:MAG: hypothetical protein ACYDCD_12965 [Candidatus Acidiferrales bacterium]
MGHPKAERARKRPRRSIPKRTVQSLASPKDRIRELRAALHNDTISKPEFRELIHREEQKNIWAARVFLRAVARDLIPDAATLARKGRSRLLAVVGNILLNSEALEIKGEAAVADAGNATYIMEHHIARPIREEMSDSEKGAIALHNASVMAESRKEWPQLDDPNAGPRR